jgi:hypothetical protein
LSREIGDSLLLAPASNVVKQNLPQVTSYSEYHSWTESHRAALRRSINALPTVYRWQASPFTNYEAHQPPLSYLILAIPERILSDVPLFMRVSILRTIAAIIGALLLLGAADHFFLQLSLSEVHRASALFCLLSCQMLWATIAHIGNDWLAIPLSAWLLVALTSYDAKPSRSVALLTAILLAGGLLTKAYFLAYVPLLLGVFVLRRRWKDLLLVSAIILALAGPWYARNMVRYSAFTGTQEARSGISLHQVVCDFPTLHWPTVLWSSIHSSIWTGNNTFSTFSVGTIDLLILIALSGLLLWMASRHTRTELVPIVYCASFILALAYATTVSHIFTHGLANQPSPWYTQVLAVPLLGLIFSGTSRWPRVGRWLISALTVLFGYIIATTYVVKLLPLYSGYEGHSVLDGLVPLYTTKFGYFSSHLDSAALVSSEFLFTLTFILIAMVATQLALLLRILVIAPRCDQHRSMIQVESSPT